MEIQEKMPQKIEDVQQNLNMYSSIADYYDLLMKAGYYDHKAIATVACSLMGERRKILELGVGTGLLAEQIMALDPNYEYTGIDIASAMLKIAQERLGERATLIEADLCNAELKDTFDIAICSAGVWFIVQREDEYELGSHILNLEENIKVLQKVAKHLLPNGLLLISSQKVNNNYESNHKINLSKEIEFYHETEELENYDNCSSFEKTFFFKVGDQVVAQDNVKFKFFKGELRDKIMREGGFELQGVYNIDDHQDFYLYQVRTDANLLLNHHS